MLRGRTKDEIIESLRALRAELIADESGEPTATPESVPALADLLATFYQAGDELQRLTPRIAAPEIDSPLLRRLGAPPASTYFDLETLYKAMTQRALSKVFSEE